MKICPIRSNRYSAGNAECCKEKCAWWLGEGCAMAYVGGNCKANLRPWNERKNDERG